MDNKKYPTDREWYDEAKAAIAALPPRTSKEKIARLIELWNDRVPEFFSRRESPSNASAHAACGKCVGRYQEVFGKRFELLEQQFAAEAETQEEKPAEPKKPTEPKKPADKAKQKSKRK